MEAYYAVEVYFHASFTTSIFVGVLLTSTYSRYFSTEYTTATNWTRGIRSSRIRMEGLDKEMNAYTSRGTESRLFSP
jgi:hypothetical protein